MIITNSSVNSVAAIRDGVEFYYFGLGCIADYYGNSIAYLDELDIEIILLCGGTKTLIEIIDCVETRTNCNRDDILNKLNKLYKKGVLIFNDLCMNKDVIFHGIKGLYFPKEVVIELTNMCNYACPFCYKNTQKQGEFITDETIANINHMIYNNVNHILITGGEPTIHPNYLKYITIFSEYAKVHMISNGSLLYNHDPNILRKLELIQFTIYGCNNEEYNRMTGVKDGFTRLCNSIEFAKKNGIDIILAVTLCDATIDHMESFVKIAVDFGIKTLRIGLADIFGRGEYLFEGTSEYEKQRIKAYDMLLELKRKYRKKINFQLPNINIDHVTNHTDIYKNVYRNSLCCGCGSEYLVISQTGEIRPCQMLPESWFSIKNENAFIEHIHGNFHVEQLQESVRKYYTDNDYETLKISPCQALENFVNLEKENYV